MEEQRPPDFDHAVYCVLTTFRGKRYVKNIHRGQKNRKRLEAMKLAMLFVLAAYLSVAFFEIPSWCHSLNSDDKCDVTLDNGKKVAVPWSTFPKMPIQASHSLELMFLLIMIGLLVGMHFGKLNSTYASLRTLVLLLLLSVGVADNLRVLITNGREVVGQYVRPFIFVLYIRVLRETCRRIYYVLRATVPVLMLIVAHIVFFSWTGTILFQHTAQEVSYFKNFPEACWSMLVLLTTANYPDVMMPAFVINRWYFIFFMLYLLLGLFFLLNLVLAVFYNNYRTEIEKVAVRYMQGRRELTHETFVTLDDNKDGVIPATLVVALLQEAKPELRLYKTTFDRMVLLAQSQGHFNEERFVKFIDLVNMFLDEKDRKSHVFRRWFPGLYVKGGWLYKTKRVLDSFLFEALINLLTVMNLLLQLFDNTNGRPDQEWWLYVQIAYLIVYWTEMLAKIIVFGPVNYLSRPSNVFDAVLNILSLILAILALTSGYRHYRRLLNYFIMLRLLRVFKLLSKIQTYSVLFKTLVSLIPIFRALMGILLAIFYFYCMLGISLFGGDIYVQNPDIYSDSTVPLTYVYNNFNDFPSGLMTLFELLIVNNWWVIAEMYTDVTTNYARWYFISFYFVAVIVGLNLMVAFVIDMFCTHWDIEQDKQKKIRQLNRSNETDETTSPETKPMVTMRATLPSSVVIDRWVEQ